MIEQKTVLDQPEPNCQTGVLGVKIAFLIVDGDVELDRKWHRTSIPVDIDPAQQMAAVNAHLAIMDPPMPQVPQIDIDFVVQCHALLKQRMESV